MLWFKFKSTQQKCNLSEQKPFGFSSRSLLSTRNRANANENGSDHNRQSPGGSSNRHNSADSISSEIGEVTSRIPSDSTTRMHHQDSSEMRDMGSDVAKNVILDDNKIRNAKTHDSNGIEVSRDKQTSRTDPDGKGTTNPTKQGPRSRQAVTFGKLLSNSERTGSELFMWYLGHRKYGEDSFIYKVFGLKTGFEILLLLCPFYHYEYWAATLGPGEINDHCTPMSTNQYIFDSILLLDALLIFFAAAKFGTFAQIYVERLEFFAFSALYPLRTARCAQHLEKKCGHFPVYGKP